MAGSFNVLGQLSADLDEVAYNTIPRVVTVLQEQGDELAKLAKAGCPHESGRLENSIWCSVDPVAMRAEIGPFAFYGHFVEFGTDKMGPRPFMGPAADEFETRFPAAMEKLGGDIL